MADSNIAFMKKVCLVFMWSFLSILAYAGVGRNEILLEDWQFRRDHNVSAADGWTAVVIPHDWAIYGPFDRNNDLQTVAVTQNGETAATVKTGRTGGLPYVGKGAYRRTLYVEPSTLDSLRHILYFDGAMSEAQVFVGDEKVCSWPYGYNSFYCDISDYIKPGENTVTVLLENRPRSSRWYPGAGLYRKVRYVTLPKICVPVWGTYITTPYVGEDYAVVKVRTCVDGLQDGDALTLHTQILDSGSTVVAETTDTQKLWNGEFTQILTVNGPSLWSPSSPSLYYAKTEVLSGAKVYTDWADGFYRHYKTRTEAGTKLEDTVCTRFGIRSIELRPGKGFYLNGEPVKFKGVCQHHDLGPLGAAVNESAIRHQLNMLKDMGCNAVRTTHNMPAEELVSLCDEMGLMLMVESFDEWDVAKCQNGYNRWFSADSGDGVKWAEKDLVNMLHHYRNNPSVVMWSVGNEVPSQGVADGARTAAWLQSICHREDPTRPVTCGMDQFDSVHNNGFAAVLDVPGYNYKTDRYLQAYGILPQKLLLGTENASTVSSRGVYHFPVVIGPNRLNEDHQSSSYDTEYCEWSNIPDDDFAADEDYPWCMGQFLWTGFDYLGEPSPYDTDAWPNHASVFGAIDMASIPKDRFWLYRSIWNEDSPTLHILPHWTWPGREGEVTPVYVYTSYPSAELFVNGVSQGVRQKASSDGRTPCLGEKAMSRFRLMWNDVVYQPGEIRVVAYDENGAAAAETAVRTAGKARALRLEPACGELQANGCDLCYITVSVVDRDGNPVPADAREVKVKVSGAGSFKAIANGDPTCLESFREPKMHLFSGQLTVIVCSGKSAGDIKVEVSARGLQKASCKIISR